jgi:hypothetical protein
MPKAEQPLDTVLLVALEILTGPNVTITEDVLRSALRLINNCCQDDGEWADLFISVVGSDADRWELPNRPRPERRLLHDGSRISAS